MRKLMIDNVVKEEVLNIQSNSFFKREMGGILIGAYDTKLECLRITDMSFPYPGDEQSSFRFFRKSKGHQEEMDRLWEESEHTKAYLGEWHTHNQDTPTPSITDCKTWKRISKRNKNFDECFFMIIGKKTFIVWTVIDGNIIEVFRGSENGEEK